MQDSHDTPPALLIIYGPPPKCQKKEAFTDAMTNAAVEITQAISASAQETPKPQYHQSQSPGPHCMLTELPGQLRL